MTPRNPEENSEKGVQDKVPQTAHEVRNRDPSAPANFVQKEPRSDNRPTEGLDTKAELDRLELYLKGPTVFTA